MFPSFVRNERVWLVVFVAIVLLVPVILGRIGLSRVDFDPEPMQRVQASQPEVVLIGDSMLGTRIDPGRLAELSAVETLVLEQEGSASAGWFLFLKNSLATSGVTPKHVIIFFRDRYLTDPEFRTSGQYLENIQLAMRGHEPLLNQLLDGRDTTRFGWLAEYFERLYPSQELLDASADYLVNRAGKLTRNLVPGDFDFADEADRTFDVRGLRPDTPTEIASEDLIRGDFDPSPTASFLPHIIDLAAANGWGLTFYRVKRRPQSGNVRIDSPDLAAYINDLRDYIESRGANLVDVIDDESIGIEYYSDGDHVAESMRTRYTERFFERNRSLFE